MDFSGAVASLSPGEGMWLLFGLRIKAGGIPKAIDQSRKPLANSGQSI